ncbi:hypothetical protein M422DRAFT_269797 [Sphaerobolus stellatus SS14]|uniref:Uncharacterized protein n=1 Tax=Sphaerobolus stellatus (strain SS14) TaxID=990650 RepID=A0A0C9U3R8_SPHS4|nr:hypothetical protein M422DRAFT_269797 [Sphaerobolus stellatus SS14]
MERHEEKRPYSAAGTEHTAYIQLNHCPPAPNKGKRPSAKTGKSSQQHLDADLESYHQAHEPVLPYEEEPPSSAPDVEMNAPVVAGASSNLQDESTMHVDHELDDLYE